MEVQGVDASLAKVDGEIEVLLVAGKPVEQENRRARLLARSPIQPAYERLAGGRDEGRD